MRILLLAGIILFNTIGSLNTFAQQPYLVKDISSITRPSYPQYLTQHGNSVFFSDQNKDCKSSIRVRNNNGYNSYDDIYPNQDTNMCVDKMETKLLIEEPS